MRTISIYLMLMLMLMGVSLGQGKDNQKGNLVTTMLVYDDVSKDGLLRNYRNVRDCLRDPSKFVGLNLYGLTTLNMSGSAQFSKHELPYIIERATGKLFIVDLRQETHGFINGEAFTLYAYRNQINVNKSVKQIYQEEQDLLAKLAIYKNITLHKVCKYQDGSFEAVQDITVNVNNTLTEQALVQQAKVNYFRLYVLDRHKPKDKQVDAFINFVRALPKNAWLHFHCKAGKGRTTTFMVMYDILHNAKHVSFKDILQRHARLGGSLLSDFSSVEKDPVNLQAAKARYDFVQKFYQYVISSDGYGKQTWSKWVKG